VIVRCRKAESARACNGFAERRPKDLLARYESRLLDSVQIALACAR